MTYAILAIGALFLGYVVLELVFHTAFHRLLNWCFDGEDPVDRLLPFRRQTRKIGDRICRRCDYDLRGLSSACCPECGAMIGFDKSMDELGLTADEIEQIKSRPATSKGTPPPPAIDTDS